MHRPLFRTVFSVHLVLDSCQCRGQWWWPGCTLSPHKEAPLYWWLPRALLFWLSRGHCSRVLIPRHPDQSLHLNVPAVPFCCLTPPWQCWRHGALAAWTRSARFHINVSLPFSTCLSVMRLVPGEHSIARWTLIPECSEREGSFSSFEDSAPL